jgi:multicomponent Na+:H+ antiporter subunit E
LQRRRGDTGEVAGRMTRGREVLVVVWIVVLGIIWWSLASGLSRALPVGVVVIALSLWARRTIEPAAPSYRWHLTGAARFVPFFLWQSIRGGFDTALRALRPSLPIRPDLFAYRSRLPEGAPLTLFARSMSLLPGTLAARISGTEITVHLLDPGSGGRAALPVLEERIAQLFGVELRGPPGDAAAPSVPGDG